LRRRRSAEVLALAFDGGDGAFAEKDGERSTTLQIQYAGGTEVGLPLRIRRAEPLGSGDRRNRKRSSLNQIAFC
jgi:hypothetical protein